MGAALGLVGGLGDALGSGGGPSSAQSTASGVTGATINVGGGMLSSVSPWVLGGVAVFVLLLAVLALAAMKARKG